MRSVRLKLSQIVPSKSKIMFIPEVYMIQFTPMDAKKYLSEYSKEFKFFKDKYFQNKIKEASKIDKIAAESIKVLSEYMEWGKHAHVALFLLHYKLAQCQNLHS